MIEIRWRGGGGVQGHKYSFIITSKATWGLAGNYEAYPSSALSLSVRAPPVESASLPFIQTQALHF